MAAFPSTFISHLLVRLYGQLDMECKLEHREGSVEEITDWVAGGVADLGLVYLAEKRLQSFQRILKSRNLAFVLLDRREPAVFVGPKNPFYEQRELEFSDLSKLRYIGTVRDYFSMEHHMDRISLGVVSAEDLYCSFITDSDQMMQLMLQKTDLARLGMYYDMPGLEGATGMAKEGDFLEETFLNQEFPPCEIRALRIKGCEPFLSFGYIYQEGRALPQEAQLFLQELRRI